MGNKMVKNTILFSSKFQSTNRRNRDKFDTPGAHDHSFSWLGRDTAMQHGGVKLVLWAQAFPLCE